MTFIDRVDAGKKLGKKIKKYKKDFIIYALPRGGVIVGSEIAKIIKCPLQLIIVKKIPHPNYPEYAIGAITQGGYKVLNKKEVERVNPEIFSKIKKNIIKEIKRRQKVYLKSLKIINPFGKNILLVDDGVATGLSIRAAIKELKSKNPNEIYVVVPVITQETAKDIQKSVDKLIAIEIPKEEVFLGAIGNYYDFFPQVSDHQLIEALNEVN